MVLKIAFFPDYKGNLYFGYIHIKLTKDDNNSLNFIPICMHVIEKFYLLHVMDFIYRYTGVGVTFCIQTSSCNLHRANL